MSDVLEAINNKLVYRHPHVFGDTKVTGASQVEENWEQLKIKEIMVINLYYQRPCIVTRRL